MKSLSKLLTNNIIGISSSGGHLSELQHAIPEKILKDIIYIASKDGRSQQSLKNYKHHFIIDPNSSKLKYIVNTVQAFYLFLLIRPSIIISTGSGMTVPFMLIGKVFGSKLIFIESGARVYTASKAGKFMYKYADQFYIQYKPLFEVYPNAKLGVLI
jgi:beta-1,4-N-acetylglucosaminyltransferase